jgi:hypothetical protein
MTSYIHLFIYEVKGPKNSASQEYSFDGLKIKNNNDPENSLIIPKELKNNSESNSSKFFSRNIIIDTKNKKKEINESNNLRKNNIPFLYKIYKTLPARITIQKLFNQYYSITEELKENIYKKIESLFKDNTEIFKSYVGKDVQENDSEIIYKINEQNPNSKIILIGDNHGSFHSFFRIILRLYVKGIITRGYKLKENYKLILLGDIVDRGNYSVELLFILLNLMLKNNTKDNLNVILIRGNHEVRSQFYSNGFLAEYSNKLNFINDINEIIDNFFKYCPSAIILNHLNTKYWLCHGGFPLDYNQYNLKNNNIYINDKNVEMSQIRWNDFNGNVTKCSLNRGAGCGLIKKNGKPNLIYLYNIGYHDLLTFLKETNIDFIIRGHTDSLSNAMLLIKNINNTKTPFFYLNDISDVLDYERSNRVSRKNILDYKHTFTSKMDDEIVTIHPNKFNKSGIKINNELELLPVLTISNNCDNGRMLYSDSYLILSSDKNSNIEKNAKRNAFISNINYNKLGKNNREEYLNNSNKIHTN